MFSFIQFITRILFTCFIPKKALVVKIILLEKEREILLRRHRLDKRHIFIRSADRLLFVLLNSIHPIKDQIAIVKPETILAWQRALIRRYWTFKSKKKSGRPSVPEETKNLILQIKNDNPFFGAKKIQGELLKLAISLDVKTIRNILKHFRRTGKIRKSLTWKSFLLSQIDSIFAMDFLTVDTMFGQRFYVFFIISHKTREIVQFAITQNPAREFVRQQLIEFEHDVNRLVYLIHDNALQFFFDYAAFSINGIKTSIEAPNMNSIAERFVGSIRREALDHFIVFNERQLFRIISEYIDYYNSKRPHQGLGQEVPKGYVPQSLGAIVKKPVLGGLFHHYERRVA